MSVFQQQSLQHVCVSGTVTTTCLCFSSSHYYAAQVSDVDVRDWQPGYTHTVASAVHVTDVPEGQYKVKLSSLFTKKRS